MPDDLYIWIVLFVAVSLPILLILFTYSLFKSKLEKQEEKSVFETEKKLSY